MKKIRKNTFFYCFLIFFIMIFSKIFQYTFLPSKYFYDSNTILYVVNNINVYSFNLNFIVNIYRFINIFHFSTLLEWSIFLSIIFNIIIFLILLKKSQYNYKEYIFIYANMFLLNIYVFNLSKDAIQLIFFLILYLVIFSQKLTSTKKMILSSIILLFEAINFRVYYGIVLILIWTIHYIYNIFLKNNKINKKNIIKIIILTLFAFFIEIFIIQLLSIDNYNSIINARSSVNIYREYSLDAVTIIHDLLGSNTNYFIFIANYLINTVRILFPVELFFKGIKYIPFIIYQIFITINLLKLGKKINKKNILFISVIISYLMVSIIFEPDFGSFVRHESTMFLFFLEMVHLNETKKI